MANAIRLIAVERGLDPRDFALIAFGGAGRCTPARSPRGSASRRARPAAPGPLLGLRRAGRARRGSTASGPTTRARSARRARPARGRRGALTRRPGGPARERRHRRRGWSASPRHALRGPELRARGPGRAPTAAGRAMRQGSTPSHAQVRLRAAGRARRVDQSAGRPRSPRSRQLPALGARGGSREPTSRPVWLDAGAAVDCPCTGARRSTPAPSLAGPAIIEEPDSTTLLLPGRRLVDARRGAR